LTATTYLYSLSLHDALPILPRLAMLPNCLYVMDSYPVVLPDVYWLTPMPLVRMVVSAYLARSVRTPVVRCFLSAASRPPAAGAKDRKSTRLNSSHLVISYAV